jgi:3-dehydroquinate dehydratase type I
MNNGKICVSVCAENLEECIDQIKRAAVLADVIELRFDCLNNIDLENLRREVKQIRRTFKGKVLATFRPSEQGGKRNLTFEQRKKFWIDSKISEFVDWADFELDLADEYTGKSGEIFDKVIKSFHDFEKTPANLGDIYAQMAVNADLLKIAVQTEDIADTLPV